ncbi:MAG: peptidylprolyl isomerase [Azonexus sp.]|jgi:peptidyl-prolyl cis-trans isomerase C|nr:peptidylprolyl isomerase [Dechloromonas sp.]MBP8195377.1 peptidylprolyl isomerase [Azonexus sp.]MBP9655898.1 peptidylprolyl isomerase [Rhodocyclaceae bacterium]MBV2194083.1 peptidylprolyl isomerase [Azonexus sp.]HRF29615.1 peptidyl-prolyl cis-trans isomerase [Azonexus sp.]
MLKLSRLAGLLVAGAIISAPALAAEKGKAFATVNGQPISQTVYNAFVAEQKAQGAPDSPELQNAVKEELVRREILAQEAKKKGMDKNPNIQGQIELAKQAVLIRAYLSDYVKANPISEAQLKAEYDVIKNNLGSTEYKSRHVLVEKEEEAKAIIAKLDKGEKFSELAKQSKDPGSKDKGGELGWSSPAAYVKPFGEALTKLKKGEYTKTPVQSDFGYHVIQLDDSRPANPPPFDQVKPQMQQRASQQQIETLVKELRSKAKVD